MIKHTISMSTYKSLLKYVDELKEYNYRPRNRENKTCIWEKTKKGYIQDKW